MRRRSALAALLPLTLLFASCSPVESLPRGVCGNGVIDPDEDCDTHPSQGYDCRQPGEAWQCSFVCDKGRCPPGYGCGTDDVCRKPNGTIESVAFAEVPSQARQLFAGDFDADRRVDVVGFEPGRARVFFLGASGDVQQVSFSASVRPSIGKMGPLPAEPEEAGADTTDDLCQSLNLGVGAALSGGDRTFTAKTYASITIDAPPGTDLVVVDALPLAFDALPENGVDFSGDETGALVAHESKGQSVPVGAFVNFGAGPTRVVLLVPDGLPENLGGRPVSGNFDLADGCHELVFAIKGDKGKGVASAVRVYKPCQQMGNAKGYEWRTALAPSDGLLAEIDTVDPVDGPVFSLDVDGDSRLDLLITVRGDYGAALRVAYGVGDGSFHSTSPAPPVMDSLPAGDNGSSLYANLPNGEAPLALGDLNGDGIPDIVDSGQVSLGTPSIEQAQGSVLFGAIHLLPRAWTEAVIVDVNANGRPDVVGCAAGAPDIDVLNGNLPNVFNPSQISTDGTVAALTIGDFDGDLVNDIAYQDALSQTESHLSIAYGRTAGGPEDPVEIGRFSSIDHVVSGNAHNFGVDNITDLGVAGRGAGDEITMSFFPGDGNRVVQSPFLLTEEITQKVHVPLLTALGSLRARAAGAELHNDLAVIAYDIPQILEGDPEEFEKSTNALRLWGLFGTGEADFDTAATVVCNMPRGSVFFPGFEETLSLVVASAEAGERGRVFAAAPRVTPDPEKGVDFGSILVEVRFDGQGGCEVLGGESPPFAGTGKLLFRVQTANLDGDDEPEVLALLRSYDPMKLGEQLGNLTPGGPPISAESSHLVVFWDGVLGSGAELLPNMPPGQPGTVSDFTTGDIDGDARPEVIVVGSESAVVYSLGPDGESLVVEGSLGADAAGAEAVLLADADGDGVNDLVVSKGGLRFYKGQPRPELVNPVEQ